MTKRMLIDATHPEETRVVVVSGTKLEELDFEVASRKPIKGNIYLAKVTRVEPSLQAAFVEYGGNRHGFLAFSEIHPDYYRIPVSDREALEIEAQRVSGRGGDESDGEGFDALPAPGANDALLDRGDDAGDEDTRGAAEEAAEEARASAADGGDADAEEADRVEQVGGDEVDEVRQRRPRTLRQYKIQEVIKRRQIMLVQVTKEERGNKGAALTTYLSLPGRYCVLMPNTPRGGGVSRKITNQTDRKRLKEILDDLDLPDGMSVILRTAGMERSKQEIKRDLDYLLRLWDSIRERTLESTAPELIYEEGNLIKRSIRDLYSREIDEIWVEGEAGYRTAKDFMRMVMPSHARKVQNYKDDLIPLFMRHQVENQIDAMHNPVVQLKSGGYIVLNQTEALVAIDVNSGRATRERNIEETATKTNLEAADEVARQLRLRDLAGLVVIDFIDMEESRNNAAVERRLKEAMKADRARIQIGRISPFGLMELSRQRLRPSLMETHFTRCPHCQGLGLVRSVESAAMEVMRAVQEEGIRRRSAEIAVTAPTAVVLYLLNQLRPALSDLERRYAFRVLVTADDALVVPAYKIDRVRARTPEEMQAIAAEFAERERQAQIAARAEAEEEAAEDATEDETVAAEETEGAAEAGEDRERGGDDQNGRRRRRRRRRRRGGDERAADGGQPETFAVLGAVDDADGEAEAEADAAEGETGSDGDETAEEASAGGDDRRKRRRGKRGGRRRRRERGDEATVEAAEGSADEALAAEPPPAPAATVPAPARIAALAPLDGPVEEASADDLLDLSSLDQPATPPATPAATPAADGPAAEAPAKPKRSAPRRRKATGTEPAAEAPAPVAEPVPEPVAEPAAEPVPAKPRRSRKAAAPVEAPAPEPVAEAPPAKPKRPSRRKAAAEPAAPSGTGAAGEPPTAPPVTEAPEPVAAPAVDPAPEPPAPATEVRTENPRRGWWNRG